MKIPAELLADDVNEKRFFARRELIDAFCPEWDGEAKEEDSLDQDNGEFQMRRDAAFHSLVISSRMPASPEANQNENKEGRPAEQKRAHEPMTKLEDVVELVSVGRGVRRLAQAPLDQREATRSCTDR